jgi:hypothetical protein
MLRGHKSPLLSSQTSVERFLPKDISQDRGSHRFLADTALFLGEGTIIYRRLNYPRSS